MAILRLISHNLWSLWQKRKPESKAHEAMKDGEQRSLVANVAKYTFTSQNLKGWRFYRYLLIFNNSYTL